MSIKVVFPYIAQLHQLPHSFPIAAQLAARNEFEVHIACSTDEQEMLVRRLMPLYPDARLHVDRLRVNAAARLYQRLSADGLPPKLPVLILNRSYFARFAAVIVPERTSLILRKLGLPRLQMIWTSHGAGDRAIGYAPDLREFDFQLLAGEKQVSRMRAEGTLHEGRFHVGCYAKFDLVQRLADGTGPMFDNGRPVVLYNPHFSRKLSSWSALGFRVLDHFAASDRYNLIFAPHVRLFSPPSEKAYRIFERYRSVPHMRIDLGSPASIDMSYTMAADIYLGDVSSQVTEFMVKPRPCVFLNPRNVEWKTSPDYLFWHLGPVIERLDQLDAALTGAVQNHSSLLSAQRAYFSDSFSSPHANSSTASAVEAIAEFLLRSKAESRPYAASL